MSRERLLPATRFVGRLAASLALFMLPWRPFWTLIARPIPQVSSAFTDVRLYPADIAVLVTLLAWAGSMLLRDRRPSFSPLWLSAALLGVIGAAWLSSPTSLDPTVSLYECLRLAMLGVLYLFLLEDTPSNPAWISVPLCLMIVLQASIGIAQVLANHSIGLQAIGDLQLDPAQAGTSVVQWGTIRLLRAYGLTDHPNLLGGSLALGGLFVLGEYLRIRSRWRVGLALALCVGVIGLFLTFSRAAWIAFGVGFVVLVWQARAWKAASTRRALAGLSFAVLILFVPLAIRYWGALADRAGIQDSFHSVFVERRSIEARVGLGQIALQVALGHPANGIGIGTLAQEVLRLQPVFGYDYEPAHLVLLDVAAETGIPGLFAYLVALVAPWILMIRLRDRPAGFGRLPVAAAMLAAITVIGLLDYYPWLLPAGQLWTWTIWGWWAHAYSNVPRQYKTLALQSPLGPEVAASTVPEA